MITQTLQSIKRGRCRSHHTSFTQKPHGPAWKHVKVHEQTQFVMVRICRLEPTKHISVMYVRAGIITAAVLCACVCRHDMFGGVTAAVGSIHHVSQWTC